MRDVLKSTWTKLTFKPDEFADKLGIKGHVKSVQGLLPRRANPTDPDYNKLESIVITIESDDEPI